MDEPTSPNFNIKWRIKIGDIVKIMRYNYDAYSVPAYGVVVNKEETNQIYMFPSVEVFLFESQQIETFPAGTVEVISSA
jgi:hypothetical protein